MVYTLDEVLKGLKGKTIELAASVIDHEGSEGIYIKTTDGKEVALVMDMEEAGLMVATSPFMFDVTFDLATEKLVVMDLYDVARFSIDKDPASKYKTPKDVYKSMDYVDLLYWVESHFKDELVELGLMRAGIGNS